MRVATAKKPSIRRSLGRKYLLVLVTVVTLALIASGLVQLVFSFRDTQTELLNLESQQAQLAAVQTSQFLSEVETQMGWVVQPVFTADAVNLDQLKAGFNQLLHQEAAITQARYLDHAGSEQLRVSRLAVTEVGSGKDFSAAAEFTRAMSGKTYFSPVYFLNGSEPYMTVSMAQGGPLGGVVSCEVNLKFVWDVIRQIRVGSAGFAYVVDDTGQLIAHPDINAVLRHTDLSSLPQVQAALAAFPQAASGNQPRTVGRQVMLARNLKTDRVLTAWDYIKQAHWTVFVEEPQAEALGPLYSTVERHVLLMLGGIVLAAAASTVLVRGLMRPLQALRMGAITIGAGALDHHIEIRTGDELEGLAEAFNEMSDKLNESYATLERKVDERTRELKEATRQVEHASRMKSEFLANMSHELRTPLNAIQGFSELLLDSTEEEIDAETRKLYLERIHDSGRHLLDLINDILDLSKIEAGWMELHRESFEVRPVINQVVSTVEPLAARKHIRLQSALTPLGELYADAGKFKQILYNLVSNAIKFTPEHGQVSVEAERDDGGLHLMVSDTGIGIAQEDQDRVFAEFQQIDSGMNRKNEGTGLGLALTKRFVEMHDGQIWLESRLGQGSRFHVKLPFAAAPAVESVEDSTPPAGNVEGPLVLLVEDNQAAAHLMLVYLTHGGYRVELASDGREALDKARRLRPAAITLDVMLPDLDGWEVLRELKGDPQTRDIPVIVASIVDNQPLGYALGASDYLVKPVDREMLLACLARYTLTSKVKERGATILVVDDDPSARELITAMLSPLHFDVVGAGSGREALQRLRASPPDAVLLDLMMPDLSGFDVLTSMRLEPSLQDIPVLIITAKDLTSSDRSLLSGRISGIFSKGSLNKRDLLAAMNRVLVAPEQRQAQSHAAV
jgi:signal transduction histidine kinase/CheY-like chemotaxis protein